jgi:peptidoglycan/LPS O-acetylase OafA/YrhL
MDFLKIFTLVLLFGYGLLIALAGPQQWRQKRVQGWSALGMLLAGVLMLFAGYLLWQGAEQALIALLVSLLALHSLTIQNSLHMHGKINWNHHTGRLGLSILLLSLTYFSLN